MKNEITIRANPTYDQAPAISKSIKEFLKALNSCGILLEPLSPQEARQVPVNAQASVNVNYSGTA
jgi:hypothetical protein